MKNNRGGLIFPYLTSHNYYDNVKQTGNLPPNWDSFRSIVEDSIGLTALRADTNNELDDKETSNIFPVFILLDILLSIC